MARPVHTATHALIVAVEADFGARDYHMRLDCDLGSLEGQTIFHAQVLRQCCAVFTGHTAELAA